MRSQGGFTGEVEIQERVTIEAEQSPVPPHRELRTPRVLHPLRRPPGMPSDVNSIFTPLEVSD